MFKSSAILSNEINKNFSTASRTFSKLPHFTCTKNHHQYNGHWLLCSSENLDIELYLGYHLQILHIDKIMSFPRSETRSKGGIPPPPPPPLLKEIKHMSIKVWTHLMYF